MPRDQPSVGQPNAEDLAQKNAIAKQSGVKISFDSQGQIKGKQLIAQRKFRAGDVILAEEATVWAWGAMKTYGAVLRGNACHNCGITNAYRSIDVPCRHADFTRSTCTLAYCSEACRKAVSPTNCTRNRTYIEFLAKVRDENRWATLAVMRMWHKQLAKEGKPDIKAGIDWFSSVNEIDRLNTWKSSNRSAFRKAYDDAYRLLELDGANSHAADILTFDYWLRCLGAYNINALDQGGLFPIHSCINHSCVPNASVEYINPKKSAKEADAPRPSYIYVVATQTIEAGEPITDEYVNSKQRVVKRRALLKKRWLFDCMCTKCRRELRERSETNKQLAMILSAVAALVVAYLAYRHFIAHDLL